MPDQSHQTSPERATDVPQPIMPNMNVPPAGTPSIHQVRQTKIILIGVGALAGLFFITTLIFGSKAATTSAKLQAQYDQGSSDGRAAQKKSDTIKFNKELTSSVRTYTAPVVDGSFEVSYPKAWSLSIDSDSSTPIKGLINPDFVNQTSKKYALRFILQNTPYIQMKKKYDDKVKNGASKTKLGKDKLASVATKVSGIEGMQYSGLIWEDNQLTGAGTLIILPLRDKTMILETDDNELYLDTFKQMIATIKLFP